MKSFGGDLTKCSIPMVVISERFLLHQGGLAAKSRWRFSGGEEIGKLMTIALCSKGLISTGKHWWRCEWNPPPPHHRYVSGLWLSFVQIMGLNPPFGVRAQLANRFIVHAINFRPKLLVLIVPPETMRLPIGSWNVFVTVSAVWKSSLACISSTFPPLIFNY